MHVPIAGELIEHDSSITGVLLRVPMNVIADQDIEISRLEIESIDVLTVLAVLTREVELHMDLPGRNTVRM